VLTVNLRLPAWERRIIVASDRSLGASSATASEVVLEPRHWRRLHGEAITIALQQLRGLQG
ncbi:unnamed protein product, partial [Closterium sp. Naga37s-1]